MLGEDVFELYVELLFLLDQYIFLRDLLCLGDQAFLEVLDLLDFLISLGVSALKLAPSVHVERLLELVGEELGFLLLLEVLLLLQVNLFLEIGNAGGFTLRNDKLALVLGNLLSQAVDVLQALLVVDLALLQS